MWSLLTFEFVVPASIVGGTEVLLVRRSVGPDGVVLTYDVARSRFTFEPSSVWIPIQIHVTTKVRSLVVANWVLERMSPKCIGLIRNGRDYRNDASGLARLIDDWTKGRPDGTPSDPPEDPPRDDDGGAPVGARLKKRPPGLGSARFP